MRRRCGQTTSASGVATIRTWVASTTRRRRRARTRRARGATRWLAWRPPLLKHRRFLRRLAPPRRPQPRRRSRRPLRPQSRQLQPRPQRLPRRHRLRPSPPRQRPPPPRRHRRRRCHLRRPPPSTALPAGPCGRTFGPAPRRTSAASTSPIRTGARRGGACGQSPSRSIRASWSNCCRWEASATSPSLAACRTPSCRPPKCASSRSFSQKPRTSNSNWSTWMRQSAVA
mmetsp:Transcript_82098/g.259067  ORF Transcript_82098/g.259067 Transcript_82098/m.259067 type:complete len:228 (+) Transcript_82098:498-1181(+)